MKLKLRTRRLLGGALVVALLMMGGAQASGDLKQGVEAWKVKDLDAVQLRMTADADGRAEITIGTNRIVFRLIANTPLTTGNLLVKGEEIVVRVYAGEKLTNVCQIPIRDLTTEPKRFCYDKLAPVVRVTPSPGPNAAGWNNTKVTVTVTAEDEPQGSGIKSISYKIGTASEVVVPKEKLALSEGGRIATYTLTLSSDDVYNLGFRAEDEAGNKSDWQTLTVRIDTARPSVSLSPSGGTYTDRVTVSWSASDSGGSGLAYCGLYVNGSRVSTNCSGSYSLGPGTHSVEVRAEDKAGNLSSTNQRYAVESKAYFYVSSITVSPGSSFPTGTTARFTVTVRNTGGQWAEKKISFYVDGAERDYVYRSLSAGSSTEVTFSYTFYSSGSYSIRIASPDDASSTTVYAQPEQPAYFRVDRIATSPSSPYVGHTTMVYATITNTGSQSATKSVELWIGDSYVTSTSLYIGPGRTEGVTFEYVFRSSGNIKVEIRTPDDYEYIYVTVVYPSH